jgi:hypothetical protein
VALPIWPDVVPEGREDRSNSRSAVHIKIRQGAVVDGRKGAIHVGIRGNRRFGSVAVANYRGGDHGHNRAFHPESLAHSFSPAAQRVSLSWLDKTLAGMTARPNSVAMYERSAEGRGKRDTASCS